jgi:hypothetical protein
LRGAAIPNFFAGRHPGLDPGSSFTSKAWIPAFAGMTKMVDAYRLQPQRHSCGCPAGRFAAADSAATTDMRMEMRSRIRQEQKKQPQAAFFLCH